MSNYAFEQTVKSLRERATDPCGEFVPAARWRACRAAAQRGR